MIRSLLILNPTAGTAHDSALAHTLERELQAVGICPKIYLTAQRGDAERAARDACQQGVDLIIAAGGDGTGAEVVNGMLGGTARLCIVPVGTANVLALELGLPLDIKQACALAAGDSLRALDVGVANGRAFTLCAGVGYDGDVVKSTRAPLKRWIGKMAYVLATVRPALLRPAAWYDLELDGVRTRERLWGAIACNTARYAGRVVLSRQARTDDGMLDMCLLHDRGRVAFICTLLRWVLQRPVHPTHMEVRRFHAATVASSPACPVQLDGDAHGVTPLQLSVLPAAIEVVVG